MSGSNMYEEKLFEFSSLFIEHSEWAGNIKVMQIGETCLDIGASIHEHNQFCDEITLFISGTGTVIAGEDTIKCCAGDIHVVSKGETHNIISDNNSALRYIHFGFGFSENASRRLADFYDQCGSVLLHDNGNVRFMLNMLVNEYAGGTEFSEEMKRNLVSTILIHVWRKANKVMSSAPVFERRAAAGNKIYNIIKYIDENIGEELTVKGIAEKFAYNDNYVSNLFREKTGNSLKHYIMLAKIEYAKRLLKENKSSMSEIADNLGYGSQQAFCKIFKKYTGYSPKRYTEITGKTVAEKEKQCLCAELNLK